MNKPNELSIIVDQIIDYFFDKRGDSGFVFDEWWVNNCVDERSYYYDLGDNERDELMLLTHEFFVRHFEQHQKTYANVQEYLQKYQ